MNQLSKPLITSLKRLWLGSSTSAWASWAPSVLSRKSDPFQIIYFDGVFCSFTLAIISCVLGTALQSTAFAFDAIMFLSCSWILPCFYQFASLSVCITCFPRPEGSVHMYHIHRNQWFAVWHHEIVYVRKVGGYKNTSA